MKVWTGQLGLRRRANARSSGFDAIPSEDLMFESAMYGQRIRRRDSVRLHETWCCAKHWGNADAATKPWRSAWSANH